MPAALQFRDYDTAPVAHYGEIWPQDTLHSLNDNAGVITPTRKKWTYEENGPARFPQHVITMAILAAVLAVPGTVLGVTHLIVNSSNKLEVSGNGASSTPPQKADNSTDVAIARDMTTAGLPFHSNESKKADSILIQNTLVPPKPDGHQCQFPLALAGDVCSMKLGGKSRVFKFSENSKRTGTMESTYCSKNGCKKDVVTFCDTGCKVSLNDLLRDSELSWGRRVFGN